MSDGGRPLVVSIIGILFILFGLGTLFVSFCCLALFAMGAVEIPGFAIGGVLLLIGLINFTIGIGCFRGWGGVWSVAIVFAILNVIISFAVWALTGFSASLVMTTLLSLLVALIVICYLMNKNVKRYFGKK